MYVYIDSKIFPLTSSLFSSLSFFLPGTTALQEDRVEASSLPRRWSTRSQLVVSARAEDDGKLFSCQAVHPALRDDPTALVASITLSVLRQYIYINLFIYLYASLYSAFIIHEYFQCASSLFLH